MWEAKGKGDRNEVGPQNALFQCKGTKGVIAIITTKQ